MHTGSSNDHVNYTLNESDLAKVNQEKDLVIIISNDLKPEKKHIFEVVKTANKISGIIGRTFEYKSEDMFFKAHVRPLLEYYVQIWWLYYRKDIEKLGSTEKSYKDDHPFEQ